MTGETPARKSAIVTLFLAAAHVVAPSVAAAPSAPVLGTATPDDVLAAAGADSYGRAIMAELSAEQLRLVRQILAGMCREFSAGRD